MFSAVFIRLEAHPTQHVDFVAMHVEAVVSPALLHELQSHKRGPVLIEDKRVPQERLYQRKEAAEEVATPFRADNAPAALWKGEGVLDEELLADVVEDLEAMDKLAALLWEVEARDHIGQELIFDPKVALIVLIKELEELILEGLRRPALCK